MHCDKKHCHGLTLSLNIKVTGKIKPREHITCHKNKADIQTVTGGQLMCQICYE